MYVFLTQDYPRTHTSAETGHKSLQKTDSQEFNLASMLALLLCSSPVEASPGTCPSAVHPRRHRHVRSLLVEVATRRSRG